MSRSAFCVVRSASGDRLTGHARRRTHNAQRSWRRALAACAVLALGAAAAADTVYLKDGRVLRGQVDAAGDDAYRLTLPQGAVTLRKGEIARLRGGPEARAAHAQRVANARPANAAAWLELGAWCEAQGLDEKAGESYRAAIAADPTSLTPLQRLSALAVDDLVYRFVQASEGARGPILEQLRPHGDRGIEGIQRAFDERMALARDHVAATGTAALTAGARKEFEQARAAIWRRVIGAAGARYGNHDRHSAEAHEVAALAGRLIALAKRKNLREALAVDPFVDRHLQAADVLAGALREVAADAGKAAAEVEALVKELTDALAQADLTSGVKADAAVEAYNASVRERNAQRRAECAITDLEWQGLQSVNWYREILGLRCLEIEPHLMKAARGHSADMVKRSFFNHYAPAPGPREPWDRAVRAGYVPKTVGENLAQQQGAPLDGWEAMKAWIISPPHHRNMLKPEYVHVGIGVVDDTWTLKLGIPLRER